MSRPLRYGDTFLIRNSPALEPVDVEIEGNQIRRFEDQIGQYWEVAQRSSGWCHVFIGLSDRGKRFRAKQKVTK